MKRNYVWSLAGMFLWTSTCLAQTDLAPKEEYRVMASTNSITLAKGQQDSVKISIIRSKSFKSGKASLSTNSPSDFWCVHVNEAASRKTG
jgi:hypothetical protein